MMKHARTYAFRNQPVFSLSEPGSSYLFNAAISQFLAVSWKRKLYKYWLKLSYFLRLPNFSASIDDSLLQRIRHLARLCNVENDAWVMTYRIPFIEGRYYLTFFDQHQQPNKFVKLAIGEGKVALGHEADILKKLPNSLGDLHIPKPFTYEQYDNVGALVLPHLQRVESNKTKITFVRDYCLRVWQETRHSVGFNQCEWFQHFLSQADQNPQLQKIKQWIVEQVATQLSVSLVHGDFRDSNIIMTYEKDQSTFWLIDWEHADFSAPYLTDLVCYISSYKSIKRVDQIVAAIRELDFVAAENLTENVVLAIAYLITLDNEAKPNRLGYELAATFNV